MALLGCIIECSTVSSMALLAMIVAITKIGTNSELEDPQQTPKPTEEPPPPTSDPKPEEENTPPRI